MFYFTAAGSLSNFIPILYSESFMLGKKAVFNGLSLELNTPFDFELRTLSVLVLFFNSKVFVDKQACFETPHYLLNTFYLR